jgi:hypothetical protein
MRPVVLKENLMRYKVTWKRNDGNLQEEMHESISEALESVKGLLGCVNVSNIQVTPIKEPRASIFKVKNGDITNFTDLGYSRKDWKEILLHTQARYPDDKFIIMQEVIL